MDGNSVEKQITARLSVDNAPDLLTPEVIELLNSLQHCFEPRRQALLAARRERQADFDTGKLPDFRTDTQAIRAGDWVCAETPGALLDRRVEITGPCEPKLIINALNSGANGFMADFEDSTAPTWGNLIAGQRALRQAVSGELSFHDAERCKTYALDPTSNTVLLVRPRGWHLDETHVQITGQAISASVFDVTVFLAHNANALAAKDRGAYLYLPKLQSMEEAVLWQDVLTELEQRLGLLSNSIKVTVLIETLPAAFEMDEIIYALRERIVGLNCGRWDYIFSYLKTLRAHAEYGLPERSQIGMEQAFLQTYASALIRTCHRRGIHAMGGMAAQIPLSDAEKNSHALNKVRRDKQREVSAGHDGTWVAHPALISVAKEIFDAAMPSANQRQRAEKVEPSEALLRELLLTPCQGTISREGFNNNVEVCVRYFAAWLDGQGCVAINGLMEDAATAEIARVQLWFWLHHGPQVLDDGSVIDMRLFECALRALPAKLIDIANLPGARCVPAAISLLDQLTKRSELPEFFTSAAYQQLT